jgi:secreted trypsin-like serine protease
MYHKINFICVLVFGNILLAYSMPNPQSGEVSLEDVLAAAGNESARYGTNSGNVDQSALCSVFGGPNCQNNENTNENLDSNDNYEYITDDSDIGGPEVKVDEKYDNCSYYQEEGFGYECVPYYNCKNGEIITDGDSLFDIRGNFGALDSQTRSGLNTFIKLDPLASKCSSYLEVCCRHPDYDEYDITVRPATVKPSTPAPKEPSPRPPVTEDPNNCIGASSCPYRQRCGRHNSGGIGVRIQNLDKFSGSTQFGEWPHMCAILKKSQVGGREVNLYVGGASLIAPGILLTAAHVVEDIVDFSNVKVRCGEWDTQQQIEPQKHVDKFARHISIHPAFNKKNLQNDFALIHLQEEFPLTEHINTMCLPDPFYSEDFDSDYETSYDDSDCFATGWGKDKFGSEGEYQVILKQVQMDLVDHDDCEDSFQKTRLGRNFDLDDSFLCAGGQPGKDTCKGDGGGPLVCPSKSNPGQYEQAGIVAWGLGCGSETPGVYADVTLALRFIDWATKCVDGSEVDYYGFGFDDRWAKKTYCGYNETIEEYKQNIVDEKRKITREDSSSGRKAIRKTINGYKKEIKKMQKLLPLYENAILNCSHGKQDFDCNIYDYGEGEVDLSDLARENSKDGEIIPKVAPRLKIPE